jgi:hypothetical protein
MRSKALESLLHDRERARDQRIAELSAEIGLLRAELAIKEAEFRRLRIERGDTMPSPPHPEKDD